MFANTVTSSLIRGEQACTISIGNIPIGAQTLTLLFGKPHPVMFGWDMSLCLFWFYFYWHLSHKKRTDKKLTDSSSKTIYFLYDSDLRNTTIIFRSFAVLFGKPPPMIFVWDFVFVIKNRAYCYLIRSILLLRLG